MAALAPPCHTFAYTPALYVELEQEGSQLLEEASKHDEGKAPHIDVAFIEQCVAELKRNQVAVVDGIGSEHIVFGCQHLMVHLSQLLNAMVRYSFVHSALTNGFTPA
jgi:hypothetical protein